MDRGQDQTLLNRCLGQQIFIQLMGAPAPTDEHMRQLAEDPGKMVTAQPRVLSALVILESYDQFGIEVRSLTEDGGRFFLPWGAVLYVLQPDE